MMRCSSPDHPARGLAALRRFVAEPPTPAERCDLCSAPLTPDHQHLVEPAQRRLVCVCHPCAVLFSSTGETKYRRVPVAIRYMQDFQLDDHQWSALMLPVVLVFFVRSSVSGKVMAVYPSPGGPTEATVDLDCWQEITRANPLLESMQADVEALLVNRVNDSRDYYLAPIDECYRLTGLIRRHWRGFSGGSEAWEEVTRFFTRLRERAITTTMRSRA